MPAPLGHSHRDDKGPRGWVARWWFARRARRVAAELRKRRP